MTDAIPVPPSVVTAVEDYVEKELADAAKYGKMVIQPHAVPVPPRTLHAFPERVRSAVRMVVMASLRSMMVVLSGD